MSSLGNHILVEFTGCDPEIMNDVSVIERDMVDAAEKAGATVINSTFHHFSPYGVSGVVVIQESHLAIHTWPEFGYAAVDLFTCGDEVDPWVSFDFLKEAFRAKNYSALEMRRGSTNLLTRMDFTVQERGGEAHVVPSPVKKRDVWFTDKDADQALSLRYTGEILYNETSPYQRVRVLESYKYGKFLALDNMVMTTEQDEYHYHEMISHPAIFTHGEVKSVLVIGGGDGGTVREVLKHDGVEKVTMVEIDEKVIEACKQHLPKIAAAFDDPRLDLKVDDGIRFVAETKEKYDLILIDGSDPVGPAEGLFSVEFYRNCHSLLNEKGILVAQGESPKFNDSAFASIHQTIADIFGKENSKVSLLYVPTYPTGMWSFQWGVKGGLSPLESPDWQAVDAFVTSKDLNYYNSDIHKGSFALPGFLRNMLNVPR